MSMQNGKPVLLTSCRSHGLSEEMKICRKCLDETVQQNLLLRQEMNKTNDLFASLLEQNKQLMEQGAKYNLQKSDGDSPQSKAPWWMRWIPWI